MPEWNYHLGEAPALRVYNTQSGFSQTAELGGSLFIIWGNTHSTSLSLLSNKRNLALLVSCVSSGCQLWKLTPGTSSEKGLGRLSGVLLNSMSEVKARRWDWSWPGILFQAGYLHSVHLLMLLFVLLSCCDPGFLLPSSGKKIDTQKVWPLPQMQCPSLDQSTVSRGGGCMITSSFCYNPMDGVMKAHFLERRYIASKSPNSPNKRITSLVAPATLEFWQAHKYLFWRGDCEGQRSCISDSSWICDQISDPDACHLILRPYAVDLVLWTSPLPPNSVPFPLLGLGPH